MKSVQKHDIVQKPLWAFSQNHEWVQSLLDLPAGMPRVQVDYLVVPGRGPNKSTSPGTSPGTPGLPVTLQGSPSGTDPIEIHGLFSGFLPVFRLQVWENQPKAGRVHDGDIDLYFGKRPNRASATTRVRGIVLFSLSGLSYTARQLSKRL